MKAEHADAQLTRLYEAHYDEVLAYCTRRIGRNDAEGATADVFAVAWRRLDEIEWETARSWLYGIARGVLANRWRSERRRRRLVGRVRGLAPEVRPLPEEQVVRRADDTEVLESLQQLKAADREVLMLAAWEELTGPEIARVLDISVSAAEQRLHRAKKRFAAVLGIRHPSPTSAPRAAEERGGAR
jgi:RNA polymerase sigma factor (sigma-70 family)